MKSYLPTLAQKMRMLQKKSTTSTILHPSSLSNDKKILIANIMQLLFKR